MSNKLLHYLWIIPIRLRDICYAIAMGINYLNRKITKVENAYE